MNGMTEAYLHVDNASPSPQSSIAHQDPEDKLSHSPRASPTPQRRRLPKISAAHLNLNNPLKHTIMILRSISNRIKVVEILEDQSVDARVLED
jgi:hypothetical protein